MFNMGNVTRILVVNEGFDKPDSGQYRPENAGGVPLAQSAGGEQLYLALPFNGGQDANTGFQLYEAVVYPNEDNDGTGLTFVIYYQGIAIKKIGEDAEPERGDDGGWTASQILKLFSGAIIAAQPPEEQASLARITRGALRDLSGDGFSSRTEANMALLSHLTGRMYQDEYYGGPLERLEIGPVGWP